MALDDLRRDARGNELQFSTNHLGHFQLVARLWPALVHAQGSRVVSVSSLGHRFSPVVFDDINFGRRAYDPQAAYGQSKTANVLLAVAVDERGKQHGIRAFSLHPGGIVGTGLTSHFSVETLQAQGVLDANGEPILDPFRDLKSCRKGRRYRSGAPPPGSSTAEAVCSAWTAISRPCLPKAPPSRSREILNPAALPASRHMPSTGRQRSVCGP
jgi:NAD(P)-dependent dehydrogenase (short-subunit alcohol dehydrogenase family)